MTVRQSVTAALIVTTLFAVACSNRAEDEQGIRDAFETYREAALAGDGAAALEVISAASRAAWDTFAELAKSGDSAAIRALPAAQRLTVLSARVQYSPAELQALSGDELFRRGIADGLIGQGTVREATVGVIQFDGDAATAELVSSNQRGPVMFFVKEDGGWHWDIAASLEVASNALDVQANQAGMSLDQLIMTSLSIMAGRPVDESIYSPNPADW